MISRRAQDMVEKALRRQAAVVLIGPRQVGKTTLAFAISEREVAPVQIRNHSVYSFIALKF